MSPSLPVPSKAALTALRGLVLGTSCTLALITEDRRRRINHALNVIENGDKIRSARNYRPGGSALAVALEEEALLENTIFPWSIPPEVPAKSKPTPPPSKEPQPPKQIAEAQEQDLRDLARGKLLRFPPPDSLTKWRSEDPQEAAKLYAFPQVSDILALIHDACRNKDLRKADIALYRMLQAYELKLAPKTLDRPWIEASALLCRTCQELGRTDGAADLLRQLIATGPLEESDYFDHQPLLLIDSLLAQQKKESPKGTEAPELPDSARSPKETLDICIDLFLPVLKGKPTGSNHAVFDIGARLLDASFSLNRHQHLIALHRRCISAVDSDTHEFTLSFIVNLHKHGEYKQAIRIFLAVFTRMTPYKESVWDMVPDVIACVEKAHGYKSARVLKVLVMLFSGTRQLSTVWVIKLLNAHWRREQNFLELEALFNYLFAANLQEVVRHPDGVYRFMIEAALEAGKEMKAESYLEEIVAQEPGIAEDPRILGLFARFSAKLGDWEGVRRAFEAMKVHDPSASMSRSKALVAVVKIYSMEHTVSQTEAFLKSYTDELKIPVNVYIVTLMAKQYGSIRDAEAFIGWLEYCCGLGFKVDGNFGNAILFNCRFRWNYPFRDLRTLYRKLVALNPDFVDKHTERIMKHAALSNSKYGGKTARGRVLSLRTTPTLHPLKRKCLENFDVLLAMKEALIYHRPGVALSVYKRAVFDRMRFSQEALKLAVQAQLSMPDKSRVARACSLVRKQQDAGNDVTDAANYIMVMHLKELYITGDKKVVDSNLKKAIQQLDHLGLKVSDRLLHRAANVCLQSEHIIGAISYAQQAASSQSEELGYNLDSFKISIRAYAELVDVEMIGTLIQKALAKQYITDHDSRVALKSARERVQRTVTTQATDRERSTALAMIEDALDKQRMAREDLQKQRVLLEGEVIRIMRKAALDAGCPPVDFAEIPYLGGKAKAKPKIEVEEKADTDMFSELLKVKVDRKPVLCAAKPSW
ncbi:hypothetical protein B0T19DRAFT_427362 [Cercophora scortea]|uniref:Pentatricopeptide repeat protein n=1 Tax=Cercophora scortea TaxID=314031 RepID=A0AAE0IF29_9PEZI|nr:hypothetical protein B0T19DRAFT_427362 [Cercophora scortea]